MTTIILLDTGVKFAPMFYCKICCGEFDEKGERSVDKGKFPLMG